MEIGTVVTVLPPFDVMFPGEHTVVEVNETDTWVMLEGIESAFDFRYIEEKE